MVYSMMSVGERQVAGISPQQEAQADAGMPAAWNSYISVADADAAATRAAELGATVIAPAFDVLDSGRMAVIQDPQGAFFSVWQAKDHHGAALVNAHGALCWNELASPDMHASSEFYSALFGWTVEPVPESDMPYNTVKSSAGSPNGGLRPVMPPGTPPHWLVYFGTDEIEATVAQVTALGGTVVVAPMEMGPGRFAVAQDPQGAVFALYGGAFES